MSNSQCIAKSGRGQLLRLPDGKVAGQLQGDVFIKPVVGSRHMLRTPRAWAIDAELYDEIRPSIQRRQPVRTKGKTPKIGSHASPHGD